MNERDCAIFDFKFVYVYCIALNADDIMLKLSFPYTLRYTLMILWLLSIKNAFSGNGGRFVQGEMCWLIEAEWRIYASVM